MMKKHLLSVFLGFIGSALLFTSASAYSILGDIDFNGKVNADDARTVLRLSVELEDIQNYNFYFADIDGNKKISAADARLILRTAVGLEKQIEHIHNYQDTLCNKPKTCIVCGMTDSDKSDSENQNFNETDLYYGITVTELPYTSNGLTINSIAFSGSKLTINVTNKTGVAIDSLSNFSYKCYDPNGTILKTGNIYLEDMTNGESCNVYFYIENDTSKITFGEATVHKG